MTRRERKRGPEYRSRLDGLEEARRVEAALSHHAAVKLYERIKRESSYSGTRVTSWAGKVM